MSDEVKKSYFGKIIALFWEPSAAFKTLAVKSGWLDVVVPLVLVILTSVASMPYITPLAIEDQKDRIAQSERLSDEQKAMYYDRIDQQVNSPRTFIIGPIFLIVRTAAVAAVLLFVGNFLFGGEVKYKSMLAVSAYGSLVDIVATGVKVPLMLSQQTVRIYTGPAILLQDDSTFLFRFCSNLDLFVLWKVFILAIGVGVIAKIKTNKTFWAIFTCWLIYCLAVAGLSGLAKI
jgi:hypothetical protein